MGALDRISAAAAVEGSLGDRIAELAEELTEATDTIEYLEENLAGLEQLRREDFGWRQIGAFGDRLMTRDGRREAAKLCRIMAATNPLTKRGLALRHSYVWGSGVEIEVRDKAGAADLAKFVQAYMTANESTLFGSQATEELERVFGTSGDIMLAHFTAPRTGTVRVRSLPVAEFDEVISNPDDRDEPWFYQRRWESVEIVNGRRQTVRSEAYYPDIRYRPLVRPKMLDDVEILWDAPILHASVNRFDGEDFGLGDAFAAIDFARAWVSYLNDWAKLMKALAKYAWVITGEDRKKAGTAATEVRRTNNAGTRVQPGQSDAGATAVMAGNKLEAIPKSGATLDAESARPLATAAAAALGVPVTMLLADPGQTGARAVAETLDKPTELEFKTRQRLWKSILRTSIDYAVNQAIRAPQGPLTGTAVRDEWGVEQFTIAGGIDRTIEVTFPELDDIDPKALLEAIAIADSLDKVPDEIIVRAALMVIPGVEDIDEIMQSLLDADGKFIPKRDSAGQAAIDRQNRGEGPDSDLSMRADDDQD